MRDVLWGKGRVSEDGKISHSDNRETDMLCAVIGNMGGRAGTWGQVGAWHLGQQWLLRDSSDCQGSYRTTLYWGLVFLSERQAIILIAIIYSHLFCARHFTRRFSFNSYSNPMK